MQSYFPKIKMFSLPSASILATVIFIVSGAQAQSPDVDCHYSGNCITSDGVFVSCSTIDSMCCSETSPNQFNLVRSYENHECCEGSGGLYNTLTEVCDHGVRTPKSKLNATGMCGVYSPINSDLQECCMKNYSYGMVYDKVAGAECCNENYLTHPNEKCCKGKIYRLSSQTCCETGESDTEFQLYDIPNGKCCQEVPYNPITKKCDATGVVPRLPDEQNICNGIAYDLERQICCNGDLISRAYQLCHLGRKRLNKSMQEHNAACRVSGNNYVTYYSPPSGNVVCLDGVGPQSLLENEAVCGNKVINNNTDLCCNDKPHHFAIREGKQCCSTGNEAYNPDIMTCCPNNRINYEIAENDGGKCCLLTAYDSRTHLCNKKNKVVTSECADSSRPPLYKRCEVTSQKIEQLKNYFTRNSMSVFVINVKANPKTKSEKWKVPRKSTVKTISWKLNSAKQIQLTGSKKQMKLKLVDLPTKKLKSIKARKCSCPEEIEPNVDYVIFTANPLKRKNMYLLPMEDLTTDTHDIVIPLAEAEKHQLFEVLLAL